MGITNFLVGSKYNVIVSKSELGIKVEYILVNVFSFLFAKKSSSVESFINNFDS